MIKKYLVFLIPMLFLTACDEKVKSTEYYEKHYQEARQKLKKCDLMDYEKRIADLGCDHADRGRAGFESKLSVDEFIKVKRNNQALDKAEKEKLNGNNR